MSDIQQPNIPSIGSKVDPNVRRGFDAMRVFFDKLFKQQGGVATSKDLLDMGDSLSGAITTATALDTTIPPKVTGLVVTGAFATILLRWDDLPYTNLAFYEVWRSETSLFTGAARVGTTNATLYSDKPANQSLSKTYWYWVRMISNASIAGPYSDSASGATANDPAYVLEILSGQIEATELHGNLTSRIDLIDTPITGLVAKAATETTARIAADGALSSQITTVQAIADGASAAVQTEATARIAADGALFAQYTLKLDVNGKVSGFGLASSGTSSLFEIVADRFAIVNNSGTGIKYPFIVDATYGVVMDTALVKNLTATNIAAGSISADRLNAGDANLINVVIGTGKITNAMIGDTIQSTIYTPGSVGWYINKNGTLEMNGGTFRGKVVFGSDSSGYANITDKPDLSPYNTAASWVKPGYTTIDGNKIYTGDAYVDTLQIKGYAVSVSAYIAASSLTFAVPPGTSASVLITVSGDNVWFEGDLWTSAYQELELKIDGTVVRKAKHPISQVIFANNTGADGEIPYVDKTPGGTVAYSHVATLSAGSHTVSIQTIGGVYPYYFVAGSPSISITMLMR